MGRKMEQWTEQEIIASEDALIDIQFAILDVMKTKSISNKDLAKMLHLSPARVSQILSSEANPTIKQIGKILHVLGFDRPFKHLIEHKYKLKFKSKMEPWEKITPEPTSAVVWYTIPHKNNKRYEDSKKAA